MKGDCLPLSLPDAACLSLPPEGPVLVTRVEAASDSL